MFAQNLLDPPLFLGPHHLGAARHLNGNKGRLDCVWASPKLVYVLIHFGFLEFLHLQLLLYFFYVSICAMPSFFFGCNSSWFQFLLLQYFSIFVSVFLFSLFATLYIASIVYLLYSIKLYRFFTTFSFCFNFHVHFIIGCLISRFLFFGFVTL